MNIQIRFSSSPIPLSYISIFPPSFMLSILITLFIFIILFPESPLLNLFKSLLFSLLWHPYLNYKQHRKHARLIDATSTISLINKVLLLF